MIKSLFVVMMATLASAAAAQSSTDHRLATKPSSYEMRIRLVPNADRAPIVFERVRGVMVFQLELRGQKVWALIDNGMPVSLIDAELARRLDIASEPSQDLLTPSGTMQTRRTGPIELLLPAMAAITSPLSAVDLSLPSKAVQRPVGILIGADLLRGVALYVRNSNKTLEIAPSGSARLPAGVRSVPLRGRFHQLDTKLNGIELTLSLDLGFNGDLSLTPAAWTKIPNLSATGKQQSANLDGRWQEQVYGMSDAVELAGVNMRGVKVARLAPGKRTNDEANSDGLLGSGLLSRYNFLLDLAAGTLHLIELPGVVSSVPQRGPLAKLSSQP